MPTYHLSESTVTDRETGLAYLDEKHEVEPWKQTNEPEYAHRCVVYFKCVVVFY
jgi:hypothetical protein